MHQCNHPALQNFVGLHPLESSVCAEGLHSRLCFHYSLSFSLLKLTFSPQLISMLCYNHDEWIFSYAHMHVLLWLL